MQVKIILVVVEMEQMGIEQHLVILMEAMETVMIEDQITEVILADSILTTKDTVQDLQLLTELAAAYS